MTIDLSGEWKVIWDKENKGIANRWFLSIPSKARNTKIPELWQNGKQEGTTAFYYKRFTLTGKEKRCILRFEGAAVYTEVWFNGKAVGDHFGAFSPFEFDVSPFARKGDNLLCVRLTKESENGDFEMMSGGDPIAANQMPLGLPMKLYPFTGFTGGVSLLAAEKALITSIDAENDPDRERINLKITFHNIKNFTANLRIVARNSKHEVCEVKKEVKLDKENSSVVFGLGFKEVHLWSPENPNLYGIEVRLDGSNAVAANFGFRKFDCKQGDFFLNDSVIKIQGVVYSRHNSAGGDYCGLAEVRKDLEAIKKLGFNTVRSGGVPFSSAVLDICDELGLLAFQEFPMEEQQSGKMGLEAVKALIPEIVRESLNHPSTAAFVLGSENGRLILENGAKLLSHIDTFDATHIAISNLNCASIDNAQNFKRGYDKNFSVTGKILGVTDPSVLPYSSHKLQLKMLSGAPFSLFLSRYGLADDEEFVIPDPFFGDSWLQENYKQFADELKKSGKILLTVKNYDILRNENLSNAGGSKKTSDSTGSEMKLLIQKIKNFLDKEANDVWKNVDDFIKNANELAFSGLAQNIQALQSCHIVSGYFLEQWADCKNNFSGIVDESRASKGYESSIKEITAPTRLLLSALERVVAPSENISFCLSFLNRKRVSDATVSVQIFDESDELDTEKNGKASKRKPLSSQSKDFSTQTSLIPLGDFSIKAPKKAGNYSLVISVSHSNNVLHSIEENIVVLEAPDLKGAFAQTEMLDNAENSSEVSRMLKSKKPILFTSALSAWADVSVLDAVAEAVKDGKILFLSDIITDDIKLFNSSKNFNLDLNYVYSSGCNGTSMHYICDAENKKNAFADLFMGKRVLDKSCAAIAPGLSLLPLDGADVYARSISISEGDLQTGVDLQILPFGKGKIIFSTLNMEGLETYALTNSIFTKIVKYAIG